LNAFSSSSPLSPHFSTKLFGLSSRDVTQLTASAVLHIYRKGHVIIDADDKPRSLMFVQEGTVSTILPSTEQPVAVTSIVGGHIFGDLSFFCPYLSYA
jgi:CRP-like cAMP-binding protein